MVEKNEPGSEFSSKPREGTSETSGKGSDCGRFCSRSQAMHSGRARWMGCLLFVVIGLGAYFAYTTYADRGWHHPSGMPWVSAHRGMDPDGAAQRAHWLVDHVFDDLDASAAQKARARAIAEAAVRDLQPLAHDQRESRDAWLALLGDGPMDRAQLEKERAETAQRFDVATKRLATALADLSDLLTPEQRRQLVGRFGSWHH